MSSAVLRSSSAYDSHRVASVDCSSSLIEHASFSKGGTEHGPNHMPTAPDLIRIRHDEIDRNRQVGKRNPHLDRRITTVADVRQDDEQIYVAVATGVPSRL